MEKELLLEVRHMNKSFGPTRALKDVDIKVYRGEIRGLIGENGSGKSTVSSIVAGIQKADSGEMFFKGQPHKPATMLDAMKSGVGMIVQEAGTVLNISVAENIFIGKENRFRKGPFIDRKAMERAGVGVADIDLVEANEAFAAQSVAVARELGLDDAKLNVNGGAIALGHPIGCSGARIIVTLLYEMAKRPEAKRGMATLCIGGGMGTATVFEKC